MKVKFNIVATGSMAEKSARPSASLNVVTAQIITQDRTILHADGTVQSFTAQGLTQPEVRLAAVNALKQSVKAGVYQANATRTAAAIVGPRRSIRSGATADRRRTPMLEVIPALLAERLPIPRRLRRATSLAQGWKTGWNGVLVAHDMTQQVTAPPVLRTANEE